jgi:hypothetical protein
MEKREIMVDKFNKTLYNLQKAVNDLADRKWVVPTLIDKCVQLENKVDQLLGEKNIQVIKNDELTKQNDILTKTISTLYNQKAHQTAKPSISAQPPLPGMDRHPHSGGGQRDEIVDLSKRVQSLERDLALHRLRKRHSGEDPTAPA